MKIILTLILTLALAKSAAAGLEQITENDRLNAENCIRHGYTREQVKQNLDNWKRDRGASHEHQETAFYLGVTMSGGNPTATQNTDGSFHFGDLKVVIICNSDGDLISVGSYNLEDNWISYLLSNPIQSGQGGGKAAIKHIIKQALLKDKTRISLSSTRKSNLFYEKLGFDLDESKSNRLHSRYTLDLTRLLIAFPEFTPYIEN